MPLHKSVSVRLSQEMRDYVEACGDDFTNGLKTIIVDHQEGLKADFDAGIMYLAARFKSVEFRELP